MPESHVNECLLNAETLPPTPSITDGARERGSDSGEAASVPAEQLASACENDEEHSAPATEEAGASGRADGESGGSARGGVSSSGVYTNGEGAEFLLQVRIHSFGFGTGGDRKRP